LDCLEPTVSWENSGRVGDLDVAYGVKASARPTTDIASLPKKVWGRARTDVAGWGVTARADVNTQDLGSADIQLDADNQGADLSLRVTASAGSTFNVRSVQATKGFELNGARLSVTPRLDFENDGQNVEISYSNDGTDVCLTASSEKQAVTVSRQIDSENRIAPTISNGGDVSVEWERRLSDDSSLTANLRPSDSLNVEWRDAAWTANVNMPIDGTNINGANVSIKRDVTF
jgi:hypothetical protein